MTSAGALGKNDGTVTRVGNTTGGASSNSVYLADVQRVLSLLAEAFAGQPRRIETGDEDTNGNAAQESLTSDNITVSGSSATTGGQGSRQDTNWRMRSQRIHGISSDGHSIFLPSVVKKYAGASENFGAYRIAVLHQAGYDEAGTFAFNMNTAARLIPDLDAAPVEQPIKPKPAWPGQPAPPTPLDLERFFDCSTDPARLKAVFTILEGWRIDLRIANRYPGAMRDLQRETAHALAQRSTTPIPPSVAGVIELLRRLSLGADRDTLLDEMPNGRFVRDIAIRTDGLTADASVYDCAQLAWYIDRLIDAAGRTGELVDPGNIEPLPGELTSADEASADSTLNDGSPIDFRGDPFQMPALNKRRAAQELADPDQLQYASDASGDHDENESSSTPKALPAATPTRRRDDSGTEKLLIDEWDYLEARYRKGWCTLAEYRLQGDPGTFHRDLMNRHRTDYMQIRRQFNAIRPEAIRRERRQPDGEEIELDRLIEWLADQRAGHTSDDRLYMQRQRAQRDVAAAFLLDMSASTDFPVADPRSAGTTNATSSNGQSDADSDADAIDIGWAPLTSLPVSDSQSPARRVIDVARESLALMSTALEALGDRHAIFGFSGQGRHHVSYGIAKLFDEACTPRTWGALAAVGPQGSTRMGTAVRRTTQRLRRESARVKVLIIVSDGYPQDLDYGPVRGNDEYGLQDTAMALQEAERLGIETFCLTVDPAGHDYLRRMCPDQRYLVIDEVNKLPLALGKVYRTLTTRQGRPRQVT